MLYDMYKSYQDNVRDGPYYPDPLPQRQLPPKELWIDFLGHKIASRIGVPAGPLLTSEWTTLAARLGFDIVTYKTIRSKAYAGHPLPNVLYIETNGQLDSHLDVVYAVEEKPKSLHDLAITNSFGMPSQSNDFLEKDIPKAINSLSEGQILVVSIVGSGKNKHEFVNDFIDAAMIAKNAGAKIIEANFSCPNVKSAEGSLYNNPNEVFDLASQLVKALNPIPLIIKVGVFSDSDQMKEVFISAARAGVQAISGINTVSKKVVDKEGKPALGADRLTSGICGAPIREIALNFVRNARKIIDHEKLPLTLIGVGGITKPTNFDDFFNVGADIAQTATGMMWDLYLASKYHRRVNETSRFSS